MARTRGLRGRLFGAGALLLAFSAACGYPPGSGRFGSLTGTINGDGSSTVFPITQAVAEEFQREASQVQVSVGVSGTGGGFKKFCAGETDVQNASRRIKPSEEKACAERGIEYVELSVAMDGLSVVVNPDNDWVDCLTVAQLHTIWDRDAQRKVDSWNEVDPSFPKRDLPLYGPGTDSGTFDYFTDQINGEEGRSRSDYTASEDDNVLVQGVRGDRDALAYFGYAYYEENRDFLKVLGIDGGSGCVEPTVETINSGDYAPLSRPLFVYVSKAGAAKPEIKAFMSFYFETVNELVRDVGYIPLSDEEFEKSKSNWEAFSQAV